MIRTDSYFLVPSCFDARALVGGCQWESMNVLRGIVGNPEAGLRGWRAPSPLSASGQPWLDNTLMLLIQTTTSALWLEHGGCGSHPFAGSDCCSLLVAALCCSRSFLLQTWLLPFSCHSLHLLLLAGEQFNWFLRLPVSGIFRDSSPLAGHHGIELGTSFIYFGVWVVCFDTHGAPSSPNAPPGCYKGTAYKVDKEFDDQQNRACQSIVPSSGYSSGFLQLSPKQPRVFSLGSAQRSQRSFSLALPSLLLQLYHW